MSRRKAKPVAPAAPPRKNGRPPHVPTPALRRQVSMLALLGHPQDVIARIVGISESTIQKYYAKDIRDARPILISKVASGLYAKAMKGDSTCMIFFLKTQGRWRENDPAQLTPPTIILQTIAPPPDEPVAAVPPVVDPPKP